ncbi:MAG TPA: hypothetical protein VGO64_02945 [Candidatus Limnocylindrales bacterium]|nr:hypothetical protein [Candidatus Limnocylindrales bacterium]
MTDEPEAELTLFEILLGAGRELPDVLEGEDAGTTTWSSSGTIFATLAGDRAEFRLDPLVARAALRTPDTSTSPRGVDWVAFAPAILDEGAADRADAWFLSAHRRAAGPRSRPN